MIPADAKIHRSDAHAETDLDGETIVMSLGTGQILSFADTAQEIWAMLRAPATLDGIVEHLMKEFDVSQETCQAEVTNFLEALLAQEMITLETT